MPAGLREWIAYAEGEVSLREPMRLRERLDVLDRLELHAESSGDAQLLMRAEALRANFEEINRSLYAALRQGIRAGKNALAPWIDALEAAPEGDGYDDRDDLVSGVLALDEPDDVAPLPPEMVFYQPTPARHIFELIRRAELSEHDVVMDMGSGLGIVPMLVAMTTAARAIGVEREQAYIDAAQRCAQNLGVARVAFECRDAREADFSKATVFYLYTPFTGEVMRSVLDAIRREAAQRPVRIASFGPCTKVVAAESWLRADGKVSTESLALFQSA
ncbi:hypothetical protein KK141_14535 [Dyella sp. LX-66]|uniref:hypothetical protein n=1 Tax=unclassified Dyella TaxID=2634549 RepID=UPI001BE00B84|nr:MULTISPECIES: hypothetical protein [unclassified Dyella]MBT2116296.1 hypothetical protein [Dyella sp. LX-1]MBT2140761.1 hypothetical protein [Dyella sp. LX-66]